MQDQKFSHLQSGKTLGITFIILDILLIGVFISMIIFGKFHLLHILLSGAITIIFTNLVYNIYKPGFTDIIFSTDGIISKTPFEQQKLTIDDIKGIWYFKQKECENIILKSYSEQCNLEGCIVVIGDRNRFLNAETVGMGFMMLKDTFNPGYTSLFYRKDLDEILENYNLQIQKRSVTIVE